MRRPWQTSQMSPPLLPKAPCCQKETADWKDREMLICYSVCEPVNKEAVHRDARSLTFFIKPLLLSFYVIQSSRLQNVRDLPQVDQDLVICHFFASSHSYKNLISDNQWAHMIEEVCWIHRLSSVVDECCGCAMPWTPVNAAYDDLPIVDTTVPTK